MIDKNNKVHVLLIDSFGLPNKTEVYEIKDKLPTANIYIDLTPRQRAGVGCAVYALDDVRHLYTIEKYLEPKYKETGLFGYLFSKKTEETAIGAVTVNVVRLPLPFMRTTQSRLLYQDAGEKRSIISSRILEEQSQPLGKNKQTAQQLQASLMEDGFKRKSRYPILNPTGMNERLRDKLETMCEYNIDCLLHITYNEKELSKHAQQFTLAGFKERMRRDTSVLDTSESPIKPPTGSDFIESSKPSSLCYSYLSLNPALNSDSAERRSGVSQKPS